MQQYKRKIELDGGYSIACNYRHIEDADPIVFIHGFGCAKEHFRHAFDSSSIEKYSLIAIDLVGFGESRGPEGFEYSMEEQADVMLKVLDQLEVGSFHLCAHSMGGLIAMEMAGLAPERILSFIDLEGNLTPEDCVFTGRVAAQTYEDFEKRGRREFVYGLRSAASGDPAIEEYLETFKMASSAALYKSAVHTVADSKRSLVEGLSLIRKPCYIYGERSRGIYPGEKLLQEKGLPLFYIKGAGHFMAVDNPEELYGVIASFIEEPA